MAITLQMPKKWIQMVDFDHQTLRQQAQVANQKQTTNRGLLRVGSSKSMEWGHNSPTNMVNSKHTWILQTLDNTGQSKQQNGGKKLGILWQRYQHECLLHELAEFSALSCDDLLVAERIKQRPFGLRDHSRKEQHWYLMILAEKDTWCIMMHHVVKPIS